MQRKRQLMLIMHRCLPPPCSQASWVDGRRLRSVRSPPSGASTERQRPDAGARKLKHEIAIDLAISECRRYYPPKDWNALFKECHAASARTTELKTLLTETLR